MLQCAMCIIVIYEANHHGVWIPWIAKAQGFSLWDGGAFFIGKGGK